ncbi:hypothetical protein A1D22_09165 [Pasteurellaceae bacterium LFhippo2]|nr:hypothetical protein [Pasteurellaceae bacterium LFhippo2]
MARPSKQTLEQKLTTLKAKLEKALALKAKYSDEVSRIQSEVKSIEAQVRYNAISGIVENPENLKTMLELGLVSQEQYEALAQKPE